MWGTYKLYARWMEVGAFSPFARAHVTSGVPGQEPWAFGQEVEDISRHRIRERYRWLPTLYGLFHEAATSGAPVLRPLIYEFQDDASLVEVDDQMMLGPSVMIAPVLTEGASTRTVRFPPGRWVELDSNATYQGPGTVTVDLRLAAVPTFVREGAIVVRSTFAPHTGAIPRDAALRIDVYPSAHVDARPRPLALYEDAGDGYGASLERTLSLEERADGTTLRITAASGSFAVPDRALDVYLQPVDGEVSAVRLDGAALMRRDDEASLEASGGYFVDGAHRAIRVRIQDGGAARELAFDYVRDLATRTDVEVVLEVSVPVETPMDAAIHVATSVDWAVHRPLEWVEPGRARGFVTVPRGAWFEYKYTRGSWETVERWLPCQEASNRYGFGAAHPTRVDAVATFRDRCE